MHGEYGKSAGPKWLLALVHLAAVGVAAWLLLGGGLQSVAALRGSAWPVASLARRWMLVGCALGYFLRVNVTVFYLLQRKFGWGEAGFIAIWAVVIHTLFAYWGGTNSQALNPVVATLALLFYVSGSVLNTGSELQRKWWKDQPQNKGRLYTGGFFRYAMHINYFGDELLFTGYAMLTGSAWAFLIPVLMIAGFVFASIPQLDRHLREHYGAEFDDYARRTREFVPFIY